MKIVQVNKDDAVFFSGVAPKNMLGLLGLPHAAALGVVERSLGVGILIFTQQAEESITIEWLYVDEEYRGFGFGASLMEKIFETAEFLKVKRVCARLPQDENFEALQLYFLQWGFGWRKTLMGEWNVTARQLYESPFARKVATIDQKYSDIKPFFEISNKAFSDAVERATGEGHGMLYDVVAGRKYLDKDVSLVSMSKGKINGYFLVHRGENVVYPVALWSEGNTPVVISHLLGSAIKEGAKVLGADDVIRVTAGSDDTLEFIRQVMPAKLEETAYMMQADADYLSNPDNMDDDFGVGGAYEVKDLFRPEDIPEGGFVVTDVEVR
ncbi:MAG: GNAT family N-acetyltransferase [Butyrivibrio sp.]|nr:GNAT family N-acetyltransferase [Butyrivibrio sp.]